MTTAEAATANGNGSTPSAEPTLPVDTYREAVPFLRRPFTARAVKFKVQSVAKDGTKALCVAYIDARLVIERLNHVVPHLWSDNEYVVVGKGLRCHLTIDGITRPDVGTTTKDPGAAGIKDIHSDALKRAAVKFGVGVSLYAVPQQWLAIDNRLIKKTNSGTFLQTDGEKELRRRYGDWLNREGIKAFGEPLDHGTSEDEVGDVEDLPQTDDIATPAAAAAEIDAGIADQGITQKRAKQLAEFAFAVGIEQKLQLAATHVHGSDVGDCSTKTKAGVALLKLTVEQADKVDTWINKKADEIAAADEQVAGDE